MLTGGHFRNGSNTRRFRSEKFIKNFTTVTQYSGTIFFAVVLRKSTLQIGDICKFCILEIFDMIRYSSENQKDFEKVNNVGCDMQKSQSTVFLCRTLNKLGFVLNHVIYEMTQNSARLLTLLIGKLNIDSMLKSLTETIKMNCT